MNYLFILEMNTFKSLAAISTIAAVTSADHYKYTCGDLSSTQGVCAHYNATLASVVLDNKACDYTKQHCSVGVVTNTVDGTCVNDVPFPNALNNYYGEPCTKDSDCFANPQETATCVNNICTKSAEPDACLNNDHKSCAVGKYCNNNKCEAQLGSGDKCTSTYQCDNLYGCYSGTCQKYGSLSAETEYDYTDAVDVYRACDTNLHTLDNTDEKKLVCVELSYREGNKADGSKLSSPPTCDIVGDNQCTAFYTKSGVTVPLPLKTCVQGYSQDGKNYCEELSNYFNLIFFSFNRGNHLDFLG